MISETHMKVFDRSDTQYVAYLTELGSMLEGRPELINDVSENLETHRCQREQNCYALESQINRGNDVKNFSYPYLKHYSENHVSLFNDVYYKFHNVDP